MTTMEFLKANGVRLLRTDKTEANSLGYWETAENLNNVVGKSVWICDFRNNEKNVFGKPIRAISPRLVVVFDAETAKKTIYYAPIYFREMKKGKLLATEISPVDNTGFRSIAGTSVQIFESQEECVACYKKLLEKAIAERKESLKKITADINELEQELIKFGRENPRSRTVG